MKVELTEDERNCLILTLGIHLGWATNQGYSDAEFKKLRRINLSLANKLGCTFELEPERKPNE